MVTDRTRVFGVSKEIPSYNRCNFNTVAMASDNVKQFRYRCTVNRWWKSCVERERERERGGGREGGEREIS